MPSNIISICIVYENIKIHIRAYKHHDHITGAPKIPKMAKNIVIVFVPPSGSSSAARRFKEETQKMVLTLVSPGGSRVTARWFLEKFQKPDSSFDIHIKYNSNLSHTTIHSLKTKAIKRNSPNLDFLAQFAKCATSFLFVNLLLALLPIQTQNLTQHSQILSFCALFLV